MGTCFPRTCVSISLLASLPAARICGHDLRISMFLQLRSLKWPKLVVRVPPMGDTKLVRREQSKYAGNYDMSNQIIKIQLPDGSVREVPYGTTAHDVAMSISPRLAAAVAVARIRPLTPVTTGTATAEEGSEAAMYGGFEGGERLVDLSAPLTEDVALELLKENDEAALKVVRHPAAHGRAPVILELF